VVNVLYEAEHVRAGAGVDDDDPLVAARLRRNHYAAVSLAGIDENNLERTHVCDILREQEKRSVSPLDLRPSVRRLLVDAEEISPPYVANLRVVLNQFLGE